LFRNPQSAIRNAFRCTPPMPPVAKTLTPAWCAAQVVVATVVAPSSRRATTTGRSRRETLRTSFAVARCSIWARSSPTTISPLMIPIVAGTAPSERTSSSRRSAVRRFAGYGSPWEITVDSSATTGACAFSPRAGDILSHLGIAFDPFFGAKHIGRHLTHAGAEPILLAMQRFLNSRLYPPVYLLLIAIACITSGSIALNTKPDAHPDEVIHADAFCYFREHWWPPEVNSGEVGYSPYGWSRVYGGEIVYLVYGRIGSLTDPVARKLLNLWLTWQRGSRYNANLAPSPFVSEGPGCAFAVETYRLQNSVLLLITLLVLFMSGKRHIWAAVIAGVLLCIPQVIYVYSYANSDAWGISWSLFLFVFAATHSRPFASYRHTIYLGLLTGIVLLSKQPYWLSLPFSYLLIGWNTVKHRDQLELAHPRILIDRIVLLGALIVLIIAPLKIVYPLSQGNYPAKIEQMREQRAAVRFKPSNPTSPRYRMASKGVSFQQIYLDPQWMELSAKSFYGLFGYMTLQLPEWIYITSGAAALLCLLLTFGMVVFRWDIIPGSRKVLLLAAPAAIALCVAASLYSSWTQDWQPQGRYLFPALVPIALLLGGTIDLEPRSMRAFRIAVWLFSYILCLYVLWGILLAGPLVSG
jgi:hypothetical protein